MDIRYLSKCKEDVAAKVLSPLSQVSLKSVLIVLVVGMCTIVWTMAPNKLHSTFLVATSLRIIEQKSRLKF